MIVKKLGRPLKFGEPACLVYVPERAKPDVEKFISEWVERNKTKENK